MIDLRQRNYLKIIVCFLPTYEISWKIWKKLSWNIPLTNEKWILFNWGLENWDENWIINEYKYTNKIRIKA